MAASPYARRCHIDLGAFCVLIEWIGSRWAGETFTSRSKIIYVGDDQSIARTIFQKAATSTSDFLGHFLLILPRE